jgi:hydrogenase maturation factor
MEPYPLGKLPHEKLDQLLSGLTIKDPRVVLGPGVGLDCAVIDFGDTYLVAKSDPITFTSEDIGWYAVHVNANDIVTTGAQPKWFLVTLLLPEGTDADLVEEIFADLQNACAEIGAELIGGHTEITADLNRPIISGTMLGEVAKSALITPKGARPGDIVLLTKGVPIEAGSIIARECTDQLSHLDPNIVNNARAYLTDPGISVVKEALIASRVGGVTAMHDPTEGGLACGLWELADAAGYGIEVTRSTITILPEAEIICRELEINPLFAIASGALLLSVAKSRVRAVTSAIEDANIPVAPIGTITKHTGVAFKEDGVEMPRPERDAIAKLFERSDVDFGASDNES